MPFPGDVSGSSPQPCLAQARISRLSPALAVGSHRDVTLRWLGQPRCGPTVVDGTAPGGPGWYRRPRRNQTPQSGGSRHRGTPMWHCLRSSAVSSGRVRYLGSRGPRGLWVSRDKRGPDRVDVPSLRREPGWMFLRPGSDGDAAVGLTPQESPCAAGHDQDAEAACRRTAGRDQSAEADRWHTVGHDQSGSCLSAYGRS
jgi:hypothetical protein